MKGITVVFVVAAVMFCWTLSAVASPVSHKAKGSAQFAMDAGTYTVGARMLFDYRPDCQSDWIRDIDVVNVWEMEVATQTNGRSQVSFTSLHSLGLIPLQDGPFSGYSLSLDFSLSQRGDGSFRGTSGLLTFYDPAGNVWDPDGNAKNGTAEKFNTSWNGQFGTSGVYGIKQTAASNFFRWKAHDIVTFVEPGTYPVETGPVWNEYGSMPDDGNPNNNISFVIPGAASAVPEPGSMLLVGGGLLGLAGFRGRKN